MFRLRRLPLITVLAGWLLITSASGCAMLEKKQPQKKEGPQTVEDWMRQPRVKP